MKRRSGLLLCLGCLLTLAGCGAKEQAEQAELFAMDTVMSLTAYGEQAQEALLASQRCIAQLEQSLSYTRADSQITALNQAAGSSVTVEPAVGELLEAAIGYSLGTEGCFEPTVAPLVYLWGFPTDRHTVPTEEAIAELLPLLGSERIAVQWTDGIPSVTLDAGQQLDLGGIAKGYASDRVEAIYRQNGIASGIASLGGNVFACGTKPDGSLWRIAIQDPQQTGEYAGTLDLADAYAVTSGSYQRYFLGEDGTVYHHIIDPATGAPSQSDLLSVTVVADANRSTEETVGSGTMCDALSTALFVMGSERASEFWRSGRYDFETVLITKDGRIVVSAGLEDAFALPEGSEYEVEYLR